MFESQTYEIILKRMLDKLPTDVDKREGSVAYDMLAPKAAELAMAYIELDNVLKFGFVDTTYGSFLDSKVSEAGIIREQAKKATGVITITGPNGVIPANTIVYTNNGIQFVTDTAATITAGSVNINITAVIAGIGGNVAANSITNIKLANMTCTNTNTTIGGADIQSDASLLQAYLTKVKKPSTSGNKYHYYNWAKEVIGIGDAKVVPTWNGANTVKVIVIDTDKKPVTAPKVLEVQTYIESQMPIGATLTVESGVNKTINIAADITISAEITMLTATNNIKAKIEEYFKSATFIDSDIKHAKIGSLILQVTGVLDYTNLTLNGASSNVALANNEVPALGTVNFT